jgi:hypothetical protein
MISEKNRKGIPLMVIVDMPSSCSFKLNIPDGMIVLE